MVGMGAARPARRVRGAILLGFEEKRGGEQRTPPPRYPLFSFWKRLPFRKDGAALHMEREREGAHAALSSLSEEKVSPLSRVNSRERPRCRQWLTRSLQLPRAIRSLSSICSHYNQAPSHYWGATVEHLSEQLHRKRWCTCSCHKCALASRPGEGGWSRFSVKTRAMSTWMLRNKVPLSLVCAQNSREPPGAHPLSLIHI